MAPGPKPLALNDLQHEKKSEKKRIKGLTSSNFCAILFLVSERNTMKNQMTLKEIERFMDAKRKREAKQRDQRRVANALFCLKYGVSA